MAVGNPFVPVTIAGYNVNPPTDDGAQTANNTVEWAKHKTKLGDPLKTGVDATNTAITAALDQRVMNAVLAKTSSYTVVLADRGKTINFTGSAASTFTLPVAADAKVGFELIVRNAGTNVLTVDGNAAETVDGLATVDLYPGQKIWLSCDGTNWLTTVTALKPGVLAKTFSDTPYAVLVDDDGRVIDVDASGGAVTINLPAAATAKNGFSLTVKKTDSSANAVTIDANSTETIDGALTKVIVNQYSSVAIVSDGVEWFIGTTSRTQTGLTPLATATASASATIEFNSVIDTTYDHYIIDIIGMRPATNDTELLMRVSTDNGSTFISTATYDSDGAANAGIFSDSSMSLSNAGTTGLSNVAGDFYHASVNLWRPADNVKTYVGADPKWVQSATNAGTGASWGRHDAAAIVDAIQFFMSSGNIAEGEFHLYGVLKP